MLSTGCKHGRRERRGSGVTVCVCVCACACVVSHPHAQFSRKALTIVSSLQPNTNGKNIIELPNARYIMSFVSVTVFQKIKATL